MVLIIESPETLDVIDQISKTTGERAETVVALAVRGRLALLDDAEAELQRRMEIYVLVKELGGAFRAAGMTSVDHGELLYDENGLPREGELTEYELRFLFPERYTLPQNHAQE